MGDLIIRTLEWLADKWHEYLSPYVILRDYEGGVLLRLGKYKNNLKTGVNWKLPIIDEVHTVITTTNTFHVANVNITTTGGETISVGVIIEYDITDVKKYILDVNEAESNAHDIARGVIASCLTEYTWEDVKQKTTATVVKNKLKKQFDDMGINIHQLIFGDVAKTRVFTIFRE
jgi:regulator of protease activity HflC (stomatin/prohibitin superfamily)